MIDIVQRPPLEWAQNGKRKHRQLKLGMAVIFYTLYVTCFSIYFIPITESVTIIYATLVTTSICLWFGPLALFFPGTSRRIYDPATLFNTVLFYYAIKGVGIEWGASTTLFRFVPLSSLTEGYLRVSVLLTFGILAWNVVYSWVVNRRRDSLVFNTHPTKPQLPSLKGMPPSVFLLTGAGLICLILLIRSLGYGLFVFILYPHARGSLGTSALGIGSPIAYTLLQGFYLMPAASILWLGSMYPKRRPSLGWWIHFIFVVFLLLVITPRAVLIGFLVTIGLAYHLLVRPLRLYSLAPIISAGAIYAYATNVWRGIAAGSFRPDLFAGIPILIKNLSIRGFVEFMLSPALADVRVFILIENFYGNILSFKYGETLSRVVTQLVPRYFWPAKPLDLGVEIGQLYSPGTISGTPPGFFAEMYMNFGAIGPILGAVVVAWGLAVIYRKWFLVERRRVNILYYCVLAPKILLLPSSTFANVMLSSFFGLASVWLGVKLARTMKSYSPRYKAHKI